jgi:excisionase family DNA binding protein
MSESAAAPHFYSIAEFAVVLGFHDPRIGGAGYQRVLAAVRRGDIRARKIGREWRVPATEVDRLAEDRVAS